MTINFYTFAKELNSTARPADAGTSYDVEIKEGSGVLRPYIRLKYTGGSPAIWNYAYIPAFGRYYYVGEWTYNERQWSTTLTVDYMASWRDQIGASSQYVTRSASEYDEDVIDGLYPAKAVPAVENQTSPFWAVPSDFRDQTLVIATMGRRGWQEYYIVSGFQYAAIASQVFASNFWDGYQFGDVTGDIVKALKQPENNVVNVTWLPVAWSTVSGAGATVTGFDFGYYEVAGTYQTISPHETVTFSRTIAFHAHPDAATRGRYVASNAYTSREVFIPAVGQIALDSDKLIGYSGLRVDVTLNLASGSASFALYADNNGTGKRITTVDTMAGVGFGYGTSRADVLGVLSAAFNTASAASSDNAAGAISGIIDGLKCAMPKQTIMNSSGSIGSFLMPMVLTETFYRQTEMDNVGKGRPLCKTRTISTQSGYVRCENVHLALPATKEEIAGVAATMEGGFFYE